MKLLNYKYTNEEIEQRFDKIRQQVFIQSKQIKTENFSVVSNDDIKLIFNLYDTHFFDNYFKENEVTSKMAFDWSKKMTSAGGKLMYYKVTKQNPVQFRMRISAYLIFNSFKNDSAKTVNLAGFQTKNRLEALMHVIEHEIIHLVEFLAFGDSSCRKDNFKKLANHIFGHTAFTHQLLTGRMEALKEYDLKVGDWVNFSFDGKEYTGFIHRITKRATVMALDKNGEYKDNKGNRFKKYYILLKYLKKLESKPV
ncbi:SprT-like domain-containing protein [Bernardetia sp.]|uniref:SprT-like domain-containing protein n=1 Tax=Bernardetia sp. TaxID=1937974 RepID=UPI0025C510E7|nr:SprT-like domain-containing protein [Bernardetia sp.]